jgi:56kDa selenium binding protein (SBP56)
MHLPSLRWKLRRKSSLTRCCSAPDFSKPDALAVIDTKPGSPTFSQIVHTVTMPNSGDEFHHFGWNACSSPAPMTVVGTLQPRANAAACPQLAKADFASSSQHVREGQRIAAGGRGARHRRHRAVGLATGEGRCLPRARARTVLVDQCSHSAEGDMRALNEGSGFDPQPVIRSIHSTCLLALVTDRAMEAWYHPSIAGMTPNRRVTWQATSDAEDS